MWSSCGAAVTGRPSIRFQSCALVRVHARSAVAFSTWRCSRPSRRWQCLVDLADVVAGFPVLVATAWGGAMCQCWWLSWPCCRRPARMVKTPPGGHRLAGTVWLGRGLGRGEGRSRSGPHQRRCRATLPGAGAAAFPDVPADTREVLAAIVVVAAIYGSPPGRHALAAGPSSAWSWGCSSPPFRCWSPGRSCGRTPSPPHHRAGARLDRAPVDWRPLTGLASWWEAPGPGGADSPSLVDRSATVPSSSCSCCPMSPARHRRSLLVGAAMVRARAPFPRPGPSQAPGVGDGHQESWRRDSGGVAGGIAALRHDLAGRLGARPGAGDRRLGRSVPGSQLRGDRDGVPAVGRGGDVCQGANGYGPLSRELGKLAKSGLWFTNWTTTGENTIAAHLALLLDNA